MFACVPDAQASRSTESVVLSDRLNATATLSWNHYMSDSSTKIDALKVNR